MIERCAIDDSVRRFDTDAPVGPVQRISGDIILIFIIWEFSLQALRTLLADLNHCYSRDKENLKKQVAGQSDFERNCRVGGGAQRRYPPWGMMGITESILSLAEGLNPSYAGIVARSKLAWNLTHSDSKNPRVLRLGGFLFTGCVVVQSRHGTRREIDTCFEKSPGKGHRFEPTLRAPVLDAYRAPQTEL